MRPAELMELLQRHLPEAQGIATAAPYSSDGDARIGPYALLVTLDSGQKTLWSITGDFRDKPGTVDPVLAAATPDSVSVPRLLPDDFGALEQAILAVVLGASAGQDVARAQKYSGKDPKPVLHYGMVLEFRDGTRAFVGLIATAGANTDRLDFKRHRVKKDKESKESKG